MASRIERRHGSVRCGLPRMSKQELAERRASNLANAQARQEQNLQPKFGFEGRLAALECRVAELEARLPKKEITFASL